MSIILRGPNTRQKDETRLSLGQFRAMTQDHLSRISESRQALHQISRPFKERGDIRPVQCKRAINDLDEMNKRVQELCELLYESAQLPLVFTALRYRLLVILHLIEEQICELTDLIDSYRMLCMSLSQQVPQQRRKIFEAFETLSQYITDILQQATFLYDEAQFQDRKLTGEQEEESTFDFTDTANSNSHKSPLYILKMRESTSEVQQQATTYHGEEEAKDSLV